MNDYEQHPIGKCYPALTTDEIDRLGDTIRNNPGSKSPVFLYEGKILDGWHWYRVCVNLNITPIFEEYIGADPVSFVIGRHEGRRNLTKGQLAVIGEELATLKNGQRPTFEAASKVVTKTREGVASQLGISSRGMDYVRSAKQNGIPEVIQATKAGKISPEKADKVSRLHKSEQPAALQRTIQKKGIRAANKAKKEQPRPQSIVFPTAEETGFPINGTMEEKDAHHRKYGRTPLHPKAVKEMLNHEAIVQGYIMAILAVTDEKQPDALTFLASLGAMGGWVPHPEKGKDWGIDFARKARKHLAILHERVPMLVERARELQIMVDNGSGKVQT